MNLKGDYSGSTSYSVGDVVRWTNGKCYVLQYPASSGTPPTNTRFWGWVGQQLQDATDLIIDAMVTTEGEIPSLANNLTTTASGKALDARQGKALKTLVDGNAEDIGTLQTSVGGLTTSLGTLYPNAKSIVLASSTADSTKTFTITVDDDGELTATEIVAEGGES